jgi:hypothetical protein
MISFKVGERISKFIGHPEAPVFDIDDSGATLMVFFNSPTENEIEQFNKNFEIRFVELRNIIMMTFKIGNLNWMDAPYSPHLSPNLTKFTLPQENQGLALTVILIDCATGEIENIRLLGLSERFTKKLFGAVMGNKMKSFDRTEYDRNLNDIYITYDTRQLVKLSSDYCKFS